MVDDKKRYKEDFETAIDGFNNVYWEAGIYTGLVNI